MQSQRSWFKRLATAQFKEGRWIPSDAFAQKDDPFVAIQDDIARYVNLFNHHAATPIRHLDPATGSDLVATLIHGSVQLRFMRRGQFLDVSLIRAQNFESTEQPLVRYITGHDCLGNASWRRGHVEISSEQVIKNAMIQLLEASTDF
jgi:hypothetical protein